MAPLIKLDLWFFPDMVHSPLLMVHYVPSFCCCRCKVWEFNEWQTDSNQSDSKFLEWKFQTKNDSFVCIMIMTGGNDILCVMGTISKLLCHHRRGYFNEVSSELIWKMSFKLTEGWWYFKYQISPRRRWQLARLSSGRNRYKYSSRKTKQLRRNRNMF